MYFWTCPCWEGCLHGRVWLLVVFWTMPVTPCIGEPGRYSEMQTHVVKWDLCWARRWGVTHLEGETRVKGPGVWVGRPAVAWHLKDDWLWFSLNTQVTLVLRSRLCNNWNIDQTEMTITLKCQKNKYLNVTKTDIKLKLKCP